MFGSCSCAICNGDIKADESCAVLHRTSGIVFVCRDCLCKLNQSYAINNMDEDRKPKLVKEGE